MLYRILSAQIVIQSSLNGWKPQIIGNVLYIELLSGGNINVCRL